MLIGSEISQNDSFTYITDMFTPECLSAFYYPSINSVKFYKYEFDFNGIYFEKHNQYYLINEGF